MSGSERARTAEYGRGARTVSIGIAATGVVTAAYFAMASHALPGAEYSQLALLWSVLFVVISVIYRPIEQLLSRTIAQRRAAGLESGHPLRAIAGIEAALGATVVVLALALRDPIQNNLFDGSATLYWVLVAGVALYGASYFARGWLSGHKWFGLYGGLVLLESCSRALFALAVAIGLTSGVDVIALGIVAAPIVSLLVVPVAFLRYRGPAGADDAEAGAAEAGEATAANAETAGTSDGPVEFTLSHGVGFAASVVAVMLAEQALLNAPVLAVNATSDDAVLAGVVFNIFLVVRAPLTLFQSVQTSLLPHLSGLDPGDRAFGHAVHTTLAAIAAFTLAVALGLLLLGPAVMRIVFGDEGTYDRGGLALVGLAMGFHLAASTYTQAALARGRAVGVAAAWLLTAAIFVAWMLSPIVGDDVLRAEVGYLGAAAVLAGVLAWMDRSAGRATAPRPRALAAGGGTAAAGGGWRRVADGGWRKGRDGVPAPTTSPGERLSRGIVEAGGPVARDHGCRDQRLSEGVSCLVLTYSPLGIHTPLPPTADHPRPVNRLPGDAVRRPCT